MLDYTPTIGYDAFAHHGRKLITRFSEKMQQPNAPLPIPADLDGIVSRVAKKTAERSRQHIGPFRLDGRTRRS